MRCFFACSLLFGAVSAFAATPSLTFKVSGGETVSLTEAQLEQTLSTYTTSFFDPHYRKIKSYECLPLGGVLERAFGAAWRDGSRPEVVFRALDGYASVAETTRLREPGGCLAIRDVDFPDWEPVGRNGATPAPFYVVWTGPGQSAESGYPWPYQLASIELTRFEEAYPQVFPAGAKAGSPAIKGFEIFKARCFRCHSINTEGGKVGPDLNAPQSVTSYRSKKWIKSYVRQPSKYRYTEMPDHLDLSDGDLEDLYHYFRWKARQPEKPAL